MSVKSPIYDVVLLSMLYIVGCMSVGGTISAVKPETVAKLSADLETAQKQIDKSAQAIEGVQGDVQTFKTTITAIQNTQNTIQMQLTNIETTNIQHNESIKSLLWTVFWIWLGIRVAGLLGHIVQAKVLPGSTIKNFFIPPWKKEKE